MEQLKPFPNVHFIKADISDRNAMKRLFASEGFDRVVNLAAQAGVRYSIKNHHAYIQSNLVGFGNLLEGCPNTASSIWTMHRAPASMAPMRACLSRCMIMSTIR
jgi:dTDP-D-glucose 4,6-dehydratase